jgi:hypothetical protein
VLRLYVAAGSTVADVTYGRGVSECVKVLETKSAVYFV